jgi:hypothetical protein
MLAPLFTIGQFTLGNPWLLLVFAPALIVPLVWWRRETALWPRVLWLFLPFLPWILLSYWTAARWHKVGEPTSTSIIDSTAALASLGTTLVLVVAGIVLCKGARILLFYSGILNLWAAAVAALLCVMATSGSWI